MSRAYDMAITVRGVESRKRKQVQRAAEQEWPGFDGWYFQCLESANILTASGSGNLCGGESEEEFADRVAQAVWAAHGVFCEVEVAATYLEELPYEQHFRGEACYAEFIVSKPKKKNASKPAAATSAAEEEKNP
ncbi:MAG TPA: hypothetical protein PK668_13255 [Myxococcota bacterium]|nr:hypothetical protein [Myxococcota bacterium]HRY93564.1 hypothetical protein [Myxococcota bacterium]